MADVQIDQIEECVFQDVNLLIVACLRILFSFICIFVGLRNERGSTLMQIERVRTMEDVPPMNLVPAQLDT